MAPKRKFNEYKICGKTTTIFIYKDNELFKCFIDTSDLYKLINLNKRWCLDWNTHTGSYYVRTTIYLGKVNGKPKYETLRLQDLIINIQLGQKVDHINHDRLDYRKKNLRVTSNSENTRNRKSRNSNNTSGYRNVTWINGWWRIQLQRNGKNYLFPERFSDVNEAGDFAEEMRKIHYGEFAGGN